MKEYGDRFYSWNTRLIKSVWYTLDDYNLNFELLSYLLYFLCLILTTTITECASFWENDYVIIETEVYFNSLNRCILTL